jgi:hypothetical protein
MSMGSHNSFLEQLHGASYISVPVSVHAFKNFLGDNEIALLMFHVNGNVP